jgi:RNA polymerase sigma-70 factor (ECF subfamily)
MKALDTLDLDRRAVFVLHELDELSMPEIAAALSIPLNTAYSRLRLARADLAAWLERCQSGRRPP